MRIGNSKRAWVLAAIVSTVGLTGAGVAMAADDGGGQPAPAVQGHHVAPQPADRDDDADDRHDDRDDRDDRDDKFDDDRDDRDDKFDNDRDDRHDDRDDDRRDD